MVNNEFYENAKLFFNDIFHGFVSIDLWKGFEELLRYYAEDAENLRRQYMGPVDEEYYKTSSPKYEAIMQELQRKNINPSNEPIISVGNMFKMLNPRLYMQYAQLMTIPAYSQEHQIQPLEDIVQGRLYTSLMDSSTIEYIKSNIPFYEQRLEMMKKTFNTLGRSYGHTITIEESNENTKDDLSKSDDDESSKESSEESEKKSKIIQDENADVNGERFYGNINDGITLAHESDHFMTSPYSSFALYSNMSEEIFQKVLTEIPSILIEMIMADYYENPYSNMYSVRLKEIQQTLQSIEKEDKYTIKNFEKLDSLLSTDQFGNNKETNMLLYSLDYEDSDAFDYYVTFKTHHIGHYIANYTYEKILEDPTNFKMYLGIKKAIAMGSLYSGPSIDLLKRLGIPIVDSDGKFSLNQDNIAQIIDSHNKYLTGDGPKHLSFANLSEPMIPDSIFEEVDQLYVDILHEYEERSGIDSTTVDEVQRLDIDYPVQTYSELVHLPLSKKDISRIKHEEALYQCCLEYRQRKNTDKEYSIEELEKIKQFLPQDDVLYRVVFGHTERYNYEALLKKIIELGITEDELLSINSGLPLDLFIPLGDIQALSTEEQRLIVYNTAGKRSTFN